MKCPTYPRPLRRRRLGSIVALVGTLVVAAIIGPRSSAVACPFCSAVQQTFAEELEAMDVVVFASMTKAADPVPADAPDTLPKSHFQISEIIKGQGWAKVDQPIEVHYFGKPELPGKYLVMGSDPPTVLWSTPLALSDRAYNYVKQVAALPKEPVERLQFFLTYLHDEEEILSRDAYDEFARAPYSDVIALKSFMKREDLLKWIQDPNVSISNRRLYLTMLGICGQPEDAQLLEKFMVSGDRQQKAGLDAMIACYLSLVGANGLPLIEEQFLGNDKAEYADTYSAIMALRFHGNETTVIPRERVIGGLRHVLKRPAMADLVIPDLARWKDWSVIPELVTLFKNADSSSNWVRVPVVNYLRACPLPEAAEQIEELKKIDPESVKRSEDFFPFSQFSGPGDPNAAPADAGTAPAVKSEQP